MRRGEQATKQNNSVPCSGGQSIFDGKRKYCIHGHAPYIINSASLASFKNKLYSIIVNFFERKTYLFRCTQEPRIAFKNLKSLKLKILTKTGSKIQKFTSLLTSELYLTKMLRLKRTQFSYAVFFEALGAAQKLISFI